ncbi:Fur family transcriptional regulator, ferric uptake regulator [Micrococcales bacterium KH10]|nr:Fur family transcriptional regulator, ferric uptake regulator [Micrococcales bacterium KH10]
MSDSFTSTLRQAGLRVTQPRLAVLGALEESPHATADEVAHSCRNALGSISVQTVYDALAALTQARIIRCLDPAGASAARYEIDVKDNHHHLVCRNCGEVHDIPCATGKQPCLDITEHFDFHIDESEVTYWGICSRCRAASMSDAPSPA